MSEDQKRRTAIFDKGYARLGEWKGLPIQAHWTILVGAFIFGGFKFVPGFWLGFALLILFHEMGHAIAVRRSGAQVIALQLDALGGRCVWRGQVEPHQRVLIAWGGVLAQAILWAVTVLSIAVIGLTPHSPYVLQLVDAWTKLNLWLIAFNLIPIAPLDGAEAWSFLSPRIARAKERMSDFRRRRRRKTLQRKMKKMDRQAAKQPIDPQLQSELDRILYGETPEDENQN